MGNGEQPFILAEEVSLPHPMSQAEAMLTLIEFQNI